MSQVLNELAFKKPDEATKIAAVRRILDGDSRIQDIADQYRVSNIQVHGWRKTYGNMAAKPQNLKALAEIKEKLEEKEEELTLAKTLPKTRRKFTEKEKQEAVELYQDGQSAQEVADAYETAVKNIYNWARALKVKKPRGKQPAKKEPKEVFKAISNNLPTRHIQMQPVEKPLEAIPASMYFVEREKLRSENTLLKTIVVDQMLELAKYRGTTH